MSIREQQNDTTFSIAMRTILSISQYSAYGPADLKYMYWGSV